MNDRYTLLANEIRAWCDKAGYRGDFIVTLMSDGVKRTEYLEWDWAGDDFIWENDWDEGQEEVYILGFFPLDMLYVTGTPLPMQTFDMYLGEDAPVKHGEWLWELADNGWANHICSECGWTENTDIHVSISYKYCPNCGANMGVDG